MFRTLAAAALLAMYGTAHGANVDNVNSVMICTSNIYADGFIYRSSSGSSLGSFPAKKSFPLYMAVSSQSGTPLDPVMPAQMTSTHEYKALDERLYINASTGAYAPVGFVSGGNTTLGKGETTWGFYSPYGVLMWYNLSSLSQAKTVHIQGFQWVPVEGSSGLTQLYWNQTQYDLAAALGSSSGIDASKATFGNCGGDAHPSVSLAS
ncbi:hypothetical protein F503_05912 [Ophiostoma piceae UAMH 11346]|uniref:Uncharacterized protein n=1 Tax=Ophiostoma piceae (strain UAMH 11346) TaxID=1262450 RepID=S3CD21_OPHP1|nr:hypothetical protein F503_05912 [Ophiostoma piceae UAMH 11346]